MGFFWTIVVLVIVLGFTWRYLALRMNSYHLLHRLHLLRRLL